VNFNYTIPRTLDAPKMFFLWELDTAFIFIFWIILGALMQTIIIGLILGFFVTRAYSQLKAEGGRGLILRFLYWYTPSDLWLTKQYPSHIKEYYG